MSFVYFYLHKLQGREHTAPWFKRARWVMAIFRLYLSSLEEELCIKNIAKYTSLKGQFSAFFLYYITVYSQTNHI